MFSPMKLTKVNKEFKFKEKFNFEQRKSESQRIRAKYPDRIPIIVSKIHNSDINDVDKHKYLVPTDLTLGQFMFILRKRLALKPEKAIFLFINNKIITMSEILSTIYENEKDADGFLYVDYAGENTFG